MLQVKFYTENPQLCYTTFSLKEDDKEFYLKIDYTNLNIKYSFYKVDDRTYVNRLTEASYTALLNILKNTAIAYSKEKNINVCKDIALDNNFDVNRDATISFNLLQFKDSDSQTTKSNIAKQINNYSNDGSFFAGFGMGFFGAIAGLFAAYAIDKRNVKNGAWCGFIIAIVIGIIIGLIVGLC